MISWLPAMVTRTTLIGSNNAVMQGGATFATGEVGQAFNLVNAPNATSGQYVNVATPVGLPVGNAARTVEIWFRTATDLTYLTDCGLVPIWNGDGARRASGLVFTATNPGKLTSTGAVMI